jgi:membrane associated rhomboid family serine protease
MNNQQYRPAGFSWLPPVIKNLLIINILFFVAQIAIGRAYPGLDIVDHLGLRFPGAEDFRIYQVVTYMFLHGDFWHLFFNMFALWMFGKPIEERFGSKRFLTYYFVTGIGAAVFHYGVIYLVDFPSMFKYINVFLNNPDIYALDAVLASNPSGLYNFEQVKQAIGSQPADPLATQSYITQAAIILQDYKAGMINSFNVIGASGAVFGILLAFGMLFPNTLIYIYFAIPIKAKYFVMIYGALELFQGIRGSGSNIAHLAHIGGMVFGFILIKLWNRRTNRPTYF